MKLVLNPDFARRHLFAAAVLFALGVWFAYDGLVSYPATPADRLYRKIEKSDPPAHVQLEAFKRQKIHAQYGFALLWLAAASAVALHLQACRRFDFVFDKGSFAFRGKRLTESDIAEKDLTRWTTKGILVLKLHSGERIRLDAWHHLGVKEFAETIGITRQAARPDGHGKAVS